jgi:Zn-dependent oligopeptidase
MKVLVNELFGITMKEVDIPLEERWDIDTTKEAAVVTNGGSDGLRKFEFHHETEGPLGTMFFDLHPRDGKFLHAAHFTIRCGRIRNEDNTINNNSAHPTTTMTTRSDHQLPIVAFHSIIILVIRTSIFVPFGGGDSVS